MNKRAMVGGVIILVVLGFAIYQGTGVGRRWKTVPAPTVPVARTTPVPTIDVAGSMELFSNSKFKYAFFRPRGWDVTAITDNKNFDDRQIFLPTETTKKGSISEISLTVISKPVNSAELATIADYNKWLESPIGATDSSGLVKKFGEKMVDGNRSVVLWQDKELGDEYDWSIMTWIRKGNVNYYITALGLGRFTELESRVFDYVSGSFRITN